MKTTAALLAMILLGPVAADAVPLRDRAMAHLGETVRVHGIRVNGIHPGYIWSDKVEWYIGFLAEKEGISYDEKKAQLEAETSLGYLPHSSEIAGSVLFFASDLSKCVTGQALHVNGGHWFGGF